jgi:hypothetical protein
MSVSKSLSNKASGNKPNRPGATACIADIAGLYPSRWDPPGESRLLAWAFCTGYRSEVVQVQVRVDFRLQLFRSAFCGRGEWKGRRDFVV